MAEKLKKQFWFLILIISSGILSCDKELDLDIDFEGEKLAISCLINPYDSVSVSIERTNDPNLGIEQRLLITSAHIVLIEDRIELTDFAYDSVSSAFVSDYLPRVGPEYQLIVEVPGYEKVISNVLSIPQEVPTSLSKGGVTDYQSGHHKSSTVYMAFKDNLQKDYYAVTIGGRGLFTSRFSGIYEDGCNFSTDISVSGFVSFDDYCFNGLEPTIEFDVAYHSTLNLGVHLYSYDPGTYNYLRQLSKYNHAITFPELYAEQVRIPSAFENAYGVFGAYNYSVSNILFE